MAAYAALVSLMHTLEQILHPAQFWILLDRKQIEFLLAKVRSLQDFLEDYSHQSSKGIDGLESQMAKFAYAAEDLIEFHILDQIRPPPAGKVEKSSTHFSQDIQKLLEEMDLIQTKVLEIKETMEGKKDQQPINSLSNISSRLVPSSQNTMLGFDEKLIQIMDRLTGKQLNRQVFTITGMGGIGKTTLAKNVYDHPFIVQYFHLRAWVTVSQEYSVREIILALLHDINKRKEESLESDDQLGEQLYKSLCGRTYLIVMDDIWSTEAWNEVRAFFPDNCNGSRILITTRLSNVAVHCDSYSPFEMDFLNEDKSWDLFCEKVFPQEGCPLELKDIGMEIVKNCRGLPLAIVVIGGLLAKSNKTREYWDHVAENINSMINSGNDDYCLKLLSLSFSHLPIHLKPCFLYMAAFPEDCDIRVSRLIKLWVAEGFLKPARDKSLEDVAREYLIDLIERNLILVRRRGIIGKMKSCGVHDLLRDLCLREAQKGNFLCVTKLHSLDIPPHIEGTRRLSIHCNVKEQRYYPHVLHALRSASFARSMVCESQWYSHLLTENLRLLRVLDVVDEYPPEQIMQLVNLRYMSLEYIKGDLNLWLSSISILWNLQTIIISETLWENPIILPSKIWEMPQLRHLEFCKVVLPDPSCSHNDKQNSFILENLQTLFTAKDFKFTDEVLKRVPILKKLKITYGDLSMGMEWSYFCLNNLVHLHKLESLTCRVFDKISVENLAFPCSLKKLTLSGCTIPWKDMTIVGSLPNLEVLKLERNACEGSDWYPVEGEFVRLKYLKIEKNYLVNWVVESCHFPRLEHLVLHYLELEEIPMGFRDLPTLRLIELKFCSDSVISSAKQILEEQVNMGNEDLQVQVTIWDGMESDFVSLANKNFQVNVLSGPSPSHSSLQVRKMIRKLLK